MQWEQGILGKPTNKARFVDTEPLYDAELPELPQGWVWVRAGQICGYITAGSTPSSDKLFSGFGDIPFIKVYNLTKNTRLDFSVNPTFVSQETNESQLFRSHVIPGDVLPILLVHHLEKSRLFLMLTPNGMLKSSYRHF